MGVNIPEEGKFQKQLQEPNLHITFLTIFPEMFPGPLAYSLSGKAMEKGIWSYSVINIRDFGVTKHKNVDDTPFGGAAGGGAGMVMRPDVLGKAIDSAIEALSSDNYQIYYMSPKGSRLKQSMLFDVIKQEQIIIICGRFEGIDQRVIQYYNISEISIGDFIISGGELAALTFSDACIRVLDGVVANQANITNDSFTDNLLEYPLYTKPYDWRSIKAPDVLISGNHKAINDWRLKKAQELTQSLRPDLWDLYIKNKDKK